MSVVNACRKTAIGATLTRRRSARGFTMVEALTVLLIIAIGAAIAMPMLAGVIAGQRLRAAGTDLMSSLLVARSEAIKRRAQVALTPLAPGDWAAGWRVAAVANDEQIDKRNALGTRVVVPVAPATIVYERTGRLSIAGTTQIEIRDGDTESAVNSRCLSIDPSGLPRLNVGGCQ